MVVALMAFSTYKTSNELTWSQPVTCGLTLPGSVDMRRCIVRINGGVSRLVLYSLAVDASVSLIQNRNGPAPRVCNVHALSYPMVRS